MDAELAWVGETERKLVSLGPLSLEPDVTVAQLQVQRAFNIDIIRHKDTVDQLLKTREDILESCSEEQRDALKVRNKTDCRAREGEIKQFRKDNPIVTHAFSGRDLILLSHVELKYLVLEQQLCCFLFYSCLSFSF